MKHINKTKVIFYFIAPISWYYIGTRDEEHIKQVMYNKGLYISSQFKQYKVWDAYVEPSIIRQMSIIFKAGDAFIKGLVSDNDTDLLVEYKHDIEKELEDNLNHDKKDKKD